MRLRDLNVREGHKKPDGSYVGLRLSDDSKAKIKEMMKALKVPNPIGSSKMHMTVIYSRKYLPELKPHGKLDTPMTATPAKLDIFPSQGENKVLVVVLDSPDMTKRHNELMSKHDAEYDFDEYKPHLTLSYDCGDYDIKSKDIKEYMLPLEIDEEYYEDLNLNWNNK